MPRGGLRANNPGGRPRNSVPTKAIRLPEPIAIKAKAGYYEKLEALIADYKKRNASRSPGSRDWTQLARFLAGVEKLEAEAETTDK